MHNTELEHSKLALATSVAAAPEFLGLQRHLHLTQQQLREALLARVYSEFDLDGDGQVGAEELMAVGNTRQNLGQNERPWTVESNQKLLRYIGADREGYISHNQFVTHFSQALADEDDVQFTKTVGEFTECARNCRVAKLAARAKVATHWGQQRVALALSLSESNSALEHCRESCVKLEQEKVEALVDWSDVLNERIELQKLSNQLEDQMKVCEQSLIVDKDIASTLRCSQLEAECTIGQLREALESVEPQMANLKEQARVDVAQIERLTKELAKCCKELARIRRPELARRSADRSFEAATPDWTAPLLTEKSAGVHYESGCCSAPVLIEQCIASSYDEGTSATVEAQVQQLTAKYKNKKAEDFAAEARGSTLSTAHQHNAGKA